jgi:NAD-dependent dihydropyrimidine dehydrogenase PreA subunit
MAGKAKVIISFLLLVTLVVALSWFSVKIWGEKPEKIPPAQSLAFQGEMTVAEFGQRNRLPDSVLKNAFGLQTQGDLERKLGEFGLSEKEVLDRVDKAMALGAEYESKNWIKIPVKFALWVAFLLVVLEKIRKGRIIPQGRRKFYLGAVALFGVILGSDPSPMGTVKDAIVLLGAKGVVFPPRLIALTIFLLLVWVANKFICSWGCQLGTLQDLIFRFNRTGEDKKSIFKQYKVPFAVTNGVRVAVFTFFTLIAFLWTMDVIDPIDPFKIYKPTVLGIWGGTFLGGLLLASLFVYRPWCHLFCPFGLMGWVVEKISVFKIQVNYESCIACEACARACPSTVMGAILKRDRGIPDCFACGTCIGVCPTNSIHFQAGKRSQPPAGKFKR